MSCRSAIVAGLVAAALATAISAASADDSRYPDLKGQWVRKDNPNWIPPGSNRKAPLTPEYQAIYDANRRDLAEGGPGDTPSTFCYPQGMPMMMNMYDPMEIIVTPEITYLLISHVNDSYRRIYTDGRDWPKDEDPTYAGYSIGKWVSSKGDGNYDELQIETRNLKGPRVYDASGLPLHHDNQSVIKERLYLDKNDPNVIYDEITVIDHALTEPWSITKRAFRNRDPRPYWRSEVCAEGNVWVKIGKEAYYLDPEGVLMPVKKNQPPPDLKYFRKTTN